MGSWAAGVRADQEQEGGAGAADKALPREATLTGNSRKGRIWGRRTGSGRVRSGASPHPSGGWLPCSSPRGRMRLHRQWGDRGRGPTGQCGAVPLGGDVSPGVGAPRASWLGREQPASGPSGSAPITLRPLGSPSWEPRPHPTGAHSRASPGLPGPGGWVWWVLRALALSSRREGRAHPWTPPAGPAAASFILKAPLPLGSRPSARPGPRVEGGAVSTCFAPSPRASRPSPRSGPRWANTCWAGTRRAPFPASRAEPHESRPAHSGGAR